MPMVPMVAACSVAVMLDEQESIDRTNPVGLYNQGVSYLEAASTVMASNKRLAFDDPVYFLIGHGLELVFKAFLRHQGTPVRDLQTEYGHDLDRCLSALSADHINRLELTAQEIELVRFVNHEYRAKLFEYITTGTRQRVPTEAFEPMISRLIGLQRAIVRYLLDGGSRLSA